MALRAPSQRLANPYVLAVAGLALACSEPADGGKAPNAGAGGGAGNSGGSAGSSTSAGAGGGVAAAGGTAGIGTGGTGTGGAGSSGGTLGGMPGAAGLGSGAGSGAGQSAGAPAGGSDAGGSGQGGNATTGGSAGTDASGGAVHGGSSGAASAGVGGSGGSSGNGGSGGAGSSGAPAGGGSGGSAPFGVCTGTPAKAVTIYMIGDSTMSIYDSTRYPRMGWGQPFGDLFASACAKVVDKALSGRSSKSFSDEGAWTPVKNALVAGDYVFIQFGHNDEKSDDATLYTEPQTTYKQFLTMYVNDTRAKGATPLLLTPIHRNGWTGTTIKDSHGAYPPAVRELAAALNVELIDLHALTKTYFERLGQAATTVLFMNLAAGEFPNYPDGNSDNTHLRETGARAIGRLAMVDAYAQHLTVATFLKAVPTNP